MTQCYCALKRLQYSVALIFTGKFKKLFDSHYFIAVVWN